MHPTGRLWKYLGLICLVSFAILLWLGREIYLAKPPIPSAVVSEDGSVLFTGEQIKRGQQVWLMETGGQQLGTVWGHGSYVAPDWSADWLHREALQLRDIRAQQEFGKLYNDLNADQQGTLDSQLQREMRTNRYDAASDRITVSTQRATAVKDVASHYVALFGSDPSLNQLRDQYAMNSGVVVTADDRVALASFFFWSAWSATTDRPGETGVTYTNNWPHEPLVANTPTVANGMWSIASVVMLLAGIAGMIWYHMSHGEQEDSVATPAADPLFNVTRTPSMRATKKYFYVVIGLLLTQVAMGSLTAHYAVEGHSVFGLPIADVLPWVASRTIHTQFGVLWIATAWLATGLYISPLLSGHEPRLQKLGVNVLFWALLFIVVGSTVCGWLGTLQHRGTDFNFWIGNQGLAYTAMGRVWQLLLFVGLLFWLFLMGRALMPALKDRNTKGRGLIGMVFLSATCIGLFYASSLAWGQNTHYSMIEYWRWWLVHLWVEGFFEVFATAVIALIFSRLGLVRIESANRAIVAETIVFLFGGILGTLHHLYFTGATTAVIAFGAVFSACEVIPLALIGFEGWQTYRRMQAAPWVQSYKWMILCFVAVGVWNTVGAGLLGFSINPPISLYYVQGLNMTPAHGHAALFGVYGMLGIGLMLFCLRGMTERKAWDDTLLKPAFWLLNVGLFMMVFFSILPSGIYEAWACMTKGLWYARSPEVIHSPLMEALVWIRVPGDLLFAAGVLYLGWFALRLLRRVEPTQPAETATVQRVTQRV